MQPTLHLALSDLVVLPPAMPFSVPPGSRHFPASRCRHCPGARDPTRVGLLSLLLHAAVRPTAGASGSESFAPQLSGGLYRSAGRRRFWQFFVPASAQEMPGTVHFDLMLVRVRIRQSRGGGPLGAMLFPEITPTTLPSLHTFAGCLVLFTTVRSVMVGGGGLCCSKHHTEGMVKSLDTRRC